MAAMLSTLYTILVFVVVSTEGNATEITTNIVSTEGCIIPGYPVLTETIRVLTEPAAEVKPNCTQFVPLIQNNSTHIWVHVEALVLFDVWDLNMFYCCYRNFSAERLVENVSYSQCTEFISHIMAQHKFVRVECYYTDNKIYDDFFLFHINLANPSFYGLPRPVKATHRKSNKVQPLNVLMLGFESMSRLHFIRSMPKMAEYLRQKGSVELLGYNKLGDNSYPNLFPLLTGKSFTEVRSACKPDRVFDTQKCPFVWDQYKRAGYATALGADSSAGLLGIYEYVLPSLPTDFYLQPFLYETRFLFKDRTYDYHLCLRNKYYYQVLLSYIRSVTHDVRNAKFFGIFWEESVSHAHFDYNHIMDRNYADLLEELEDNGFLNKTIVVVFSDHGTRFGAIAETEQGRQESRLPLFEVLLPPDFRRSHKLAYENLKNNSRRLTTPNDVHDMLMDILTPPSLEDRYIKRREKSLHLDSNHISLFLPIPENRTCRSIGISDHWCTCRKGVKVAVGVKTKLFAAQYLTKHLNERVKRLPHCSKFELEKILDVTMMKENRSHTYTVVVQLSPGSAMFEGTLVVEEGLWAVAGDVSRLNLYRDQSHCIQDAMLKPYCVCKQRRL